MKRSLAFVLIAIVALSAIGCSKKDAESGGAASSALAKGVKVDSLYFEFKMSGSFGESSGKIWRLGSKMKNEIEAGGQKGITIIDLKTKEVVNYIPDQNIAYKLPAADMIDTVQTPADYAKKASSGDFKITGRQTLDGYSCQVIEGKEGSGTIKVWVREDIGLPLRVEVANTSTGKGVMEYKNIKVGDVTEDSFKLPEGVQVIDQTKM